MSADIRITVAEFEALAGLPHSVCWLYIQLRRRMDYATGMAGIRPLISWRAMREEMHVWSHQGIAEEMPDKAQLKRWVAWLEKVGLVRTETRGKQLIFRFLKANTDKSVQKKADPRPTHPSRPTSDPSKPKQNKGFEVSGYKPTTHVRPTKADPHPVSGNTGSSSKLCSNSPRARVDPGELKTTLRHLGKKHPRLAFDAITVGLAEGWAERGVTPADIEAVVGDLLTRRCKPEQIHVGYLVGPVNDYLTTRTRAARGSAGRTVAGANPSEEGGQVVDSRAEAAEVAPSVVMIGGLAQRPGESYETFLARVDANVRSRQ